jgi:hypothetical protein
MNTTPEYKRRSPRVAVSKNITVISNNFVKGNVVNLSKCGLLIEIPINRGTITIGNEYNTTLDGAGVVTVIPKWRKSSTEFMEFIGCEVVNFKRKWYKFLTNEYYKPLYCN